MNRPWSTSRLLEATEPSLDDRSSEDLGSVDEFIQPSSFIYRVLLQVGGERKRTEIIAPNKEDAIRQVALLRGVVLEVERLTENIDDLGDIEDFDTPKPPQEVVDKWHYLWNETNNLSALTCAKVVAYRFNVDLESLIAAICEDAETTNTYIPDEIKYYTEDTDEDKKSNSRLIDNLVKLYLEHRATGLTPLESAVAVENVTGCPVKMLTTAFKLGLQDLAQEIEDQM